MIRAAQNGDLSRIAEILVFGKRTAYRAIFSDDEGSFNGLQVLSVADDYRKAPSLLAQTLVYDDGIVKGVLRRRYDGDTAELCELYVEPFFTGQGIGHALVTHFLKEARERGARRVTLWVIEENRSARRFYESFGFRPDGSVQPVEGTAVPELRYCRAL